MTLTDIERLVLKANRLFEKPEQKVAFVNSRLGYLDNSGIVLKGFEGKSMKQAKFYRTLAKIKDRKRTRQRFHEIGKDFLYDTINTLDLYETISNDTEKDIEVAHSNNQILLVNSLRKTLIELQPYITALREDLRELLEEGDISIDEAEDNSFTAFRESQERETENPRILSKSS